MVHGVSSALDTWLSDALSDPGPFELEPLSGGNSNETLVLRSPTAERVLRRPPAAAISKSAHSMEREHRIIAALADTDVPHPRALALSDDPPVLVMERVDGVALTDELPDGYPDPVEAVTQIGYAAVDALAKLHSAPWRDIGLADFGRPEGFLDRQVKRWAGQLENYRTRELPWFDELADWLAANRPPDGEPGILHGDFHLDNTLMSRAAPIKVEAIIDWEMATIGDPLLDLGLLLGFWGPDRPDDPAMPRVQGVSRVHGAPTRAELAAAYQEKSGRSVEHVHWYMALAFWKLAAIVEGAYAQYVDGRLDSRYARELEHDVPALLREAAGFAGLSA
jgi:aminoglycoside phosphotransferase (APT) family kinase protein